MTSPVSSFDTEGESQVAFFSAIRCDRRNRANLIESATPCYDAQVVGSYWVSNLLRLTVLASKPDDYIESHNAFRYCCRERAET